MNVNFAELCDRERLTLAVRWPRTFHWGQLEPWAGVRRSLPCGVVCWRWQRFSFWIISLVRSFKSAYRSTNGINRSFHLLMAESAEPPQQLFRSAKGYVDLASVVLNPCEKHTCNTVNLMSVTWCMASVMDACVWVSVLIILKLISCVRMFEDFFPIWPLDSCAVVYYRLDRAVAQVSEPCMIKHTNVVTFGHNSEGSLSQSTPISHILNKHSSRWSLDLHTDIVRTTQCLDHHM